MTARQPNETYAGKVYKKATNRHRRQGWGSALGQWVLMKQDGGAAMSQL